MTIEKITLNSWLRSWESGELADPNLDVQINKAGWWDWFCKDHTLANKLKTIGPKIRKILWLGGFDKQNDTIYIREYAPVVGKAYVGFGVHTTGGHVSVIFQGPYVDVVVFPTNGEMVQITEEVEFSNRARRRGGYDRVPSSGTKWADFKKELELGTIRTKLKKALEG